MNTLSRRTFLQRFGVALAGALWQPGMPNDWDTETPLVARMRTDLEAIFAGYNMALEFRRVNALDNEEFRIQINAYTRYPVASCFKAWVALYYYYYTAPEAWQDAQGSALYSAIVFSGNTATGEVLADVAGRVLGNRNPIEKFNDFLLQKVGMANGLHTWKWEGSPTVGFSDPRYAPSETRQVFMGDEAYAVDNIFTATDLAHGYDVLVRGPVFAQVDRLRNALIATDKLLSVRAPDYQSPIERASGGAYMGKDGILPIGDLPLGRVVNDAGVLTMGNNRYIIAFLSAGQSETVAINVLSEVIRQAEFYEASVGG